MTGIDVAVVGAGLMGAATAWAAARRGRSVAVFEQFGLGHRNGSSHGSARIFRRAYADPLYVTMTGRARELWRELETETGTELLRITGGLDYGARRDPAGIADRLSGAGVPHELLSAREATARWPGMVFAGPVVFHPEAGVIDADAAVRAFVSGVELHEHMPVVRIERHDDAVTLHTNDSRVRARRVVIAAGAWVGELVGDLPVLEVTQQQVFHFPRADPDADWPIFVHKESLDIYGLPGGRDGGPGEAQKVAEHDGGRPVTARGRDGAVDPAARARLTEHVRRWLPGLVPSPVNETTCLYTSTATSDFLLDRVGPAVICSACSGHGAKFAPLIGELAVDLADGASPVDRFRLHGAPAT